MSELISFNVSDIKKQIAEDKLQKTDDCSDNVVKSDDDIICDKLDVEVSNISLIECFWGQDVDRILSTTTVLKKLLKTNASKCEWIFIEAQKNKSDATFGWVKKYGIKYVFKKIPKESEFLWLKMPLWNIGANIAKNDKLCFIDSDVYFENDDWLNSASVALDKFDVISLAGFIRSNDNSKTLESFAHKVMSNEENCKDIEYGHPGLTLGMTRKAYDMFGYFDAVNYLDDQWFWFNVIGRKSCPSNFVLPYDPKDNFEDGYPFNIGSTEETCIQLNTYDKTERYSLAHDISYDHVEYPMQDIIYDKDSDSLPIWSNCPVGRVMKNCFKKFFSEKFTKQTYIEEFKKEFGNIDDEHPLVVVTIYKPDYIHKTTECVLKHKEMFDKFCKNEFTYVCFSNEKIEGIDCIPYKLKKNKKLVDSIEDIIFSKNVVYPKNAIVLFSCVDAEFNENFEVLVNKTANFIL